MKIHLIWNNNEFTNTNLKKNYFWINPIIPDFRVFLDAVNLTDAPLTMYLGTPDHIQQREYYSWWARLGLRVDF